MKKTINTINRKLINISKHKSKVSIFETTLQSTFKTSKFKTFLQLINDEAQEILIIEKDIKHLFYGNVYLLNIIELNYMSKKVRLC